LGGFLGRFEHQMDDKGRLALPAAFRRGAEGEPLVLMHGWDDLHLTLLPQPVWRQLLDRLMEVRRSDANAANAVRRLLANASEVVPDKQGRILVPAGLQEAAGLTGAVILHGNIDRVELWAPDRFHSTVEVVPPADREMLARFKNRLML
jgi:MraZ protein